MKNAKVWHFYALFHKELKNYSQTVKCYNMAYKNDPSNFGLIKDISYLLLFLGRYNDFYEYSKTGVEVKSTLVVNWVQYSFAEFLINNYENALKVIDIVIKIGEDTLKKTEYNEIVLYKSNIYAKLNQYQKCIELLESEFEKHCADKATFYDVLIKSCVKVGDVEKGTKYCNLALKNNPENINTYLSYFNLKCKEVNLNKYEDLFKFDENSKERQKLYEILVTEIEPQLTKVKITDKIKLGLAFGEEFQKLFINYFVKNIKTNLPSFFINIKFIYQYPAQKSKIDQIEKIITENITEIETNKKLSQNLNISESPTTPLFIWIYYFSAQHYDILGNSEKALEYINKAIKYTPSVVEFYMVKSRILRHNLLFDEAAKAMCKAKDLDLSDRYLNAKHAKALLRSGDLEKSCLVMMDFVKNPLIEENMLRYQCLWYKIESGLVYLQQNKILHAHRMFRGIISNFVEMYEDQSDFYNYSLRRYMLNDFYKLILHMKAMYRNKIFIQSLFYLDLIRTALQTENNKNSEELKKKLEEEFKDVTEKNEVKIYKYTNYEDLIKSINDDLYKFLQIIQSVTKCSKVHYLCVKEFLLRNKPLKALKSYLVLMNDNVNNNEDNFFAYKGYVLFNNYMKNNTINKDILEIINKNIDGLNTKNNENFQGKNISPINKIIYQLYDCEKMYDVENEKIIEKLISEVKKRYQKM